MWARRFELELSRAGPRTATLLERGPSGCLPVPIIFAVATRHAILRKTCLHEAAAGHGGVVVVSGEAVCAAQEMRGGESLCCDQRTPRGLWHSVRIVRARTRRSSALSLRGSTIATSCLRAGQSPPTVAPSQDRTFNTPDPREESVTVEKRVVICHRSDGLVPLNFHQGRFGLCRVEGESLRRGRS